MDTSCTQLKIVVFTNHSTHGIEILQFAHEQNIVIEAVILEEPSPKRAQKRIQRLLKQVGVIGTANHILRILLARFQRRFTNAPSTMSIYESIAKSVYTVSGFNADDCRALLTDMEPDVLVLAGSRIIKPHILEIPKIGVLNAHPGLLPDYRGVDVVAWAVYNDAPVGVTVHWVDPGVDTGDIIVKEVVDVGAGDTLEQIAANAEKTAAKLMTQVLHDIAQHGRGTTSTPQTREAGKQYYRMTEKLRNQVRRKLRRNAYHP